MNKLILSLFACVLLVAIWATSAWMTSMEPRGRRDTPTCFGASNVEEMKQAWKTWQEEKLAAPETPSAIDLTKDMLEMAIDFVQTGKEMEKGLPNAENVNSSYDDLTEVEKQLQNTLEEIRSKSI